MSKKIKELLGSLRFWLVVIFSITYALGYGNVIDQAIAKAIEMVALITATIGTIDKFSQSK